MVAMLAACCIHQLRTFPQSVAISFYLDNGMVSFWCDHGNGLQEDAGFCYIFPSVLHEKMNTKCIS